MSGSENIKSHLREKITEIERTSLSKAYRSDLSEEAVLAYKKIGRLVNYREHSSAALRQRLAKEGFSEEAIDHALGKAQDCALVDDERFANCLVRSRLSQGRGQQGIAQELQKLGIDALKIESFQEHLNLEDPEVEFRRAISLLNKKPPTAKNKKEAAYRKLVQRGFSSPVASRACRDWYNSLHVDTNE